MRIGILVRMRNVAGKRKDFACAELEAITGNENRHLPAKAREEFSRSRQVRRSAHRAARREIHHGQHFFGNRFGHERPHRHATSLTLESDIGRRPLAYLGPRRREQFVDGNAERIGDFDQYGERWVTFARFQVRDRRARDAGGFRERVLRQRAGVTEREQIAR